MRSMLAVVPLVAVLAVPADIAAAGSWQAIRPQGEDARTLLTRALDRSSTVRALAARIAASDVIVYFEVRRDLPSGMAACLTWMADTASHRIVRVSIRQGLRRTDGIAFVAHELQHAVEVIAHPDVRSAADLDDLYRRIGEKGAPTQPHWDTLEAVEAERVARMEAQGLRPAMARRSG